MTKIAILGASGYTALELVKILLRHPAVEIVAATSRQEEAPRLAELHPSLTGRIDLAANRSIRSAAEARRGVRLRLFAARGQHEGPACLLQRGLRVVDLSADYRLRDPNVYAQWYGESHEDLAYLTQAVYGLPEIYGDDIPTAQLIANPGCYPQTAILGLAPLVAGKYVEMDSIIIDSKSGVSGAGRTPKLSSLFSECNESVAAYSVGKHRHTPEIEQTLGDVAGDAVQVVFTPHLIPMDRGIFSTIYATPAAPWPNGRCWTSTASITARRRLSASSITCRRRRTAGARTSLT